MTWSDFYLVCFLLGFGLSALALLLGNIHLHLPHLDFGHDIHMPDMHADMGGDMHADVHAGDGGDGGHGAHHAQLPWFNFGTIAAFLAWFGGTGYLLDHYYSVWFVTALGIATLSGLGGSSVVFWFLAKVLMRREAALDPADYDMVGVLGRVSSPIRAGGTGEMVYSQEGTRRVAGARSEGGTAIPRGAEVVVTRYEKGIAYVRAWDEIAGDVEQRA